MKPLSLYQSRHFPHGWQKGKWLSVVCVVCIYQEGMLASRLPPSHTCLLHTSRSMLTSSALLSAFLTLSFSSSWVSPAHSYTILLRTLLFQLRSLFFCSLFCLCSLCLLLSFFPSLSVSCSAPASLVARSGLLAMFSQSLSLSALDDSKCPWMFSISYLQ